MVLSADFFRRGFWIVGTTIGLLQRSVLRTKCRSQLFKFLVSPSPTGPFVLGILPSLPSSTTPQSYERQIASRRRQYAKSAFAKTERSGFELRYVAGEAALSFADLRKMFHSLRLFTPNREPVT